MNQKLCQNLEEVVDHPYAGYLLSILHFWGRDNEEFNNATLQEILRTQDNLRKAMRVLFEGNPAFDVPQIRDLCNHVLELISKTTEPLGPITNFKPQKIHDRQTEIPKNLLDLPYEPEKEEYKPLIQEVAFEPERGRYTQHSRAFDRCVILHQNSQYTVSEGCGPRRDRFDLLRQSPSLFTALGRFVREHFPGIQLVDVGAGTPEGIVTWAELFGAKACVYIDKAYDKSSHEKRGETDFYKLPGDALHVVSQLPNGIGSFHVSGMELMPRCDGRQYLQALAEEMFKKTAPGGLLFLGESHCSLRPHIVSEAGFNEVIIPDDRYRHFMAEPQTRYRVFRKEISG